MVVVITVHHDAPSLLFIEGQHFLPNAQVQELAFHRLVGSHVVEAMVGRGMGDGEVVDEIIVAALAAAHLLRVEEVAVFVVNCDYLNTLNGLQTAVFPLIGKRLRADCVLVNA